MFKLTKLILATSLSVFFSQASFADPVIELDNKNYVQCIKQLNSVKDEFPVILIYAKNCPYAQIFLPTYAAVAQYESQLGRAFFQFNYGGASLEVVNKCLGIKRSTILVSPVITVVAQLVHPETGKIMRSMPIHAWGGAKADPQDPSKFISISPEELEHIVHIGPGELFLKSQLSTSLSQKQRG